MHFILANRVKKLTKLIALNRIIYYKNLENKYGGDIVNRTKEKINSNESVTL
jgi:hypothetical protein